MPGLSYDFAVLIGRFRFLHKGHLAAMRRGLELAGRLIVLVGSCRQPRTHRNPLTFEEVCETILGAFAPDDAARIDILPLVDRYNDVEWTIDVQAAVLSVTGRHRAHANAPRICLIGHAKDQSSYYLSMFPHFASESIPQIDNLAATPIREDYFAAATAALEKWRDALPDNVVAFLQRFAGTPQYAELAEENRFVHDFRARWACAPYPPTFHTVDAVVLYAGLILLIERRGLPGRGLLALPGGYIGEKERIQDSMLRELREETRLRVPAPVLRGSVRARQVFDHPFRSARGRVITTAFLLQLTTTPDGPPKVRGGDDAKHAFWLPLAELQPERLFEDHYHIIRQMVPLASL
jgi:bifunctional NMN adenylyltransferase/nudix hydrolase